MTLGRLLLAWLSVASWFVLVWWIAERWNAMPDRAARQVRWCVAEALVVTLFASLWFDSLGHGGWWLIFALVGLLAGFPARLRDIGPAAPARHTLLLGLLDTARYVAAGGILAWRLA